MTRPEGFTLIEILVVISIIAILASLILVAVAGIQESAKVSGAIVEVKQLNDWLEQYKLDEKILPGTEVEEIDEDTNLFPDLYRALFDDPRPTGPGGRSAPYGNLKDDRIVVEDDEGSGDYEGYRPARRSELADSTIDKYYMDPWGHPYVYRPNKGIKRQAYMMNPASADIYSLGPNGTDETVLADEDSDNDDIGNW